MNVPVGDSMIYLALIIALGVAAYSDIKRGRIPNFVTLPLLLLGLGFHTAMNGSEGLIFSAKGMGIGFGLLIVLYALGGLGAGDVKLAAATGSLIGPSAIVSAVGTGIVMGGVCAIALLVARLGWLGTMKWLQSFIKMIFLTGGRPPALPSPEKQIVVRYGPVFALGTLTSLTWQ